MKPPESPLVWPDSFPPRTQWDRFFIAIPALGPDLSFFKDLEGQQAARTEEVMNAWIDPRERRLARSLGEALQRQGGWKTPYFMPDDSTMVMVCGPDVLAYLEIDLADVFAEFNEQLGKRMPGEKWEKLIDWNNGSGCFAELVRKLIAGGVTD